MAGEPRFRPDFFDAAADPISQTAEDPCPVQLQSADIVPVKPDACENRSREDPWCRFMIDSLVNLLFRCSHRRLTRPFAPITKAGQPHSQSYVVCLECGKQFEYDLNEMRIGKAIDYSHDASVVPPNMPQPLKTKEAGTWRWTIPNFRGGVVDAVWDVSS